MRDKIIITLDLGATKCAAGIVQYDAEREILICEETCHLLLSETSSLQDLIHQIEGRLNIPFRSADAICIGAAGQFNGRELIHLAGVYPYPMPFAELAAKEKWPRFAVLHDYDTVVCATFTSYMQQPHHLIRLNDCIPEPHQRRVALGLGTGLGLKDGVLLPNGDFWLGKNEMGHIGITEPPLAEAGRSAQHQAFMQFLRATQAKSSDQITFENILTGRGLVNLYQFLYPNQAVPTPAFIGDKISAGEIPELLNLFAWYLGLFIGTVQLTFMPEGGIWITGGVVIKNLEVFQEKSFHEGITASPSYLKERETFPLAVMINPEHALIGAGYYAVKRLLAPITYLSSSLR